MDAGPSRQSSSPADGERTGPVTRRCPLCGRAIRCGDAVTRVHGSTVHTACTRRRR